MIIKKLILLFAIFLIIPKIYSQISADYPQAQIYDVAIDHINKKLSVQMCFENAPRYLYSTSETADAITTDIQWHGINKQQFMEQQNGYIDLPNNQKGCLNYTINANKSKGRLNSSRYKAQHPYDTILTIGSWLWKRSDYQRSSQALIKFSHPAVVNVSTPWTLINRTSTETHYLMQHTPDDWTGYVAFGPFERQDIFIGESRLRLAFINGVNNYNRNDFIDWIKQMTDAVAAVNGSFPVKDTQVMIIMQKASSGPVPWGQVNRGGGNGVLFIANPNSRQSTRIADWTAAHEFSHLLIPYTPYDRWFSEGFASYHQNISRVRTGLLSEQKNWEKLLAGFERGRKAANTYNAPVLKSASGRSLMQMYWGGAVIALMADVKLQDKTNGKMTLSKALAGLSDCCLNTRKDWNAKQTFEQLDNISDSKVFIELYNKIVTRKKYPDYQKLLKDLGIIEGRYGNITLNNRAPLAWIRKNIVGEQ